MNGAEPGSHATKEEDSKFKEYKKQFPDLSEKSSPTSLVIIAMERHGSWGKRTCAYWNGLVDLAHEREKKKEFPTHKSLIKRRVLQTLAIALRRVNANQILQYYRRSTLGTQRTGIRRQSLQGNR